MALNNSISWFNLPASAVRVTLSMHRKWTTLECTHLPFL